MKTEEILNVDYQKSKNKDLIQKVLKRIKPLSRYTDDVPIEALEKLIAVICKKYNLDMQWIVVMSEDAKDGRLVYSCGVKTHDKGKWLGTVYASCIYELFAKLSIKLFSESKQHGLRTKSKNEKERKARIEMIHDEAH